MYGEVTLLCYNFTYMHGSDNVEMRGRVFKLWYSYHLIGIIFLQCLVSWSFLIYISYHTTLFSRLWYFKLNHQIFFPWINCVLRCSFSWLKFQHISKRLYTHSVYFCHIHITSIRSPTVMSRDASSGFTHHRSTDTNTVSLDVLFTRCLATHLEV